MEPKIEENLMQTAMETDQSRQENTSIWVKPVLEFIHINYCVQNQIEILFNFSCGYFCYFPIYPNKSRLFVDKQKNHGNNLFSSRNAELPSIKSVRVSFDHV